MYTCISILNLTKCGAIIDFKIRPASTDLLIQACKKFIALVTGWQGFAESSLHDVHVVLKDGERAQHHLYPARQGRGWSTVVEHTPCKLEDLGLIPAGSWASFLLFFQFLLSILSFTQDWLETKHTLFFSQFSPLKTRILISEPMNLMSCLTSQSLRH